jgi:hypothetical protein
MRSNLTFEADPKPPVRGKESGRFDLKLFFDAYFSNYMFNDPDS